MELSPETVVLIDQARRALGPSFRPFVDDIAEGLRLRSTARFRAQNMLNFAQWFRQEADARGVNPDTATLRPRQSLPIFEAAQDEDDPDLQRMWAALLASSIDPDMGAFPLEFPNLLSQLSPAEARTLRILREHYGPGSGEDPRPATVEEVSHAVLDVDIRHMPAVLLHLRTLGLISGNLESIEGPGPEYLLGNSGSDGIHLTPVADALLEACEPRANDQIRE